MLSTFAVVQLAVYAAGQIPAGLVLDRVGSRAMIAGGAALITLGHVLMATAETVPLALVARILVGLGDAATLISVLRLLPLWFPSRRVPLMTQLTGILGQLGQVVSAVPFLGLMLFAGWPAAYLALAGTGVLVMVLVLLTLREDAPASPSSEHSVVGVWGQLAGMSRRPGAWLGFFTHMVTLVAPNTVLMLWGLPFLVAGQGWSEAAAGRLLSLIAISTVLLGVGIGLFVGRYQWHRSNLIIGVTVVQVLVWLLVLVPDTPRPTWVLVALMIACGLGSAACAVGFDFARTGVPHAWLGTTSGLVNVGGYSASVVAVLMVGVVLDLSAGGGGYGLDDFRLAFAVTLAPLVLIGLVGVLVSRALARRELRERAAALRG